MRPITEPCGTPLPTSEYLERVPSTTTVCLRPFRKLPIHFRTVEQTPMFESFFLNIIEWDILTNALQK